MESPCYSWGEVRDFSGEVGHKSHCVLRCCVLQQSKSRKDREGRAITQNITVS